MDPVIDVFDIGEREEMLQPVGRITPGEFNLAGLNANDNAHMQAVISNDFHMLLDHVLLDRVDLVGRNHGKTLCTWSVKNADVPAEFR
jgi:hypothetical protein